MSSEPDDLSIFFDRHEEVGGYERNRPHWRQEGKLYFVTWRQGDSLPLEQRQELERSRANWKDTFGDTPVRDLEPELRRQYYRLFNERVQRWLDAGHGSCVLRKPGPRDIVVECLKYFHGQRYQLRTFAVAGNHVHVLVIPATGIELTTITQTWKSYTAKAINKQLGRTGMLWKAESHDHIVRSPESLARIEAYILRHGEKGAYVERRSSTGRLHR